MLSEMIDFRILHCKDAAQQSRNQRNEEENTEQTERTEGFRLFRYFRLFRILSWTSIIKSRIWQVRGISLIT